MIRVALAGLVVAVAVGCGAAAPSGGSGGGDAAAPAVAAERADDAIRSAFGHGDATLLAGALTGRALTVARRQVAEAARRGTRRDEILDSRRVVHESVAGDHAEVVLLVKAHQRLLDAGQAAPAYANVLRQWRATLARRSGKWSVIDDGDLPPAQWWPS